MGATLPESAIPLLTKQLEVLQHIKAGFAEGPLSTLVEVHLPEISRAVAMAIDGKERRVWIRLDNLIDSGRGLSPDEWVAEMERKGWALGNDGVLRRPRKRVRASSASGALVSVHASPERTSKAE